MSPRSKKLLIAGVVFAGAWIYWDQWSEYDDVEEADFWSRVERGKRMMELLDMEYACLDKPDSCSDADIRAIKVEKELLEKENALYDEKYKK